MPVRKRKMTWLVGAALLFALVLIQPGDIRGQENPGGGRDFSKCVQVCNEANRECGDQCSTDCFVDFPDNKQLRDACIADCKDQVCLPAKRECKDVLCRNIKEPPTFEEP